MSLSVDVIFSTYNSIDWLEKVLLGFEQQTYSNFSVYIADDGSKDDTAEFIKQYKSSSKIVIHHIWHEDNGFRKTEILNKATRAGTSDYVIYTDGDCVPRMDFIEQHVKHAEPNRFLSGGYFKLPMSASKAIGKAEIENQLAFNKSWLMDNGLENSFKTNKLTSKGLKAFLLNSLTPTSPTWNGHNASTFRKNLIAVNGHDERMKYGGEDRELGERLTNAGIKGKQIRYYAICIHLDHPRGYVDKEAWQWNYNHRQTVRKEKIKWTDFGLKQKP